MHLAPAAEPSAGYHLVAGALESFGDTTSRWRDTLANGGYTVRHRELVAGHDPMLWDIAFLSSLREVVS